MSTRLTYTSGGLGTETDEEFEARLAQARAAGGDEPLPHVIAGQEIAEGAPFARTDPCTDDAVASRAFEATPALVERAVQAARSAAGHWRRTSWTQRCALLRAMAAGISDRHLELAAVASLETGKSRTESIVEVQEAVDLITTYADHMEHNDGYVTPLQSFVDGERNTDVLRPYGVFAVIAPFNFPAALSIGMASSALIAGNTVVFKPSEETPWTGALLAEIASAADLPPGVFNLVHGGEATGRALVDARVDGVAFTGSAAVGREIARKLQEGAYARPALTEMGGKNPAIVTANADVDKAAEGVARAAFGLAGQKCSACSRAIVHADVHDDFVERLAAWAEKLPLGDPSDRGAFLGPVVNAASVARYEAAAEAARRDGRIAAGGERPARPGHFVAPTVISDLPASHALERDELFLPFVTVTRVRSLDEALAEANAPAYGLTAGVFSEDQAELDRFLDEIQAGVVYVNRRAGATTGAWPGTQTFCGWKSSGSTGKGGLGPYYLPQFMREQSRTVVG
ncbi:MAG TPA: aldehyde dehydrogenase family protein [Solirubrobacteraceae bacterium]